MLLSGAQAAYVGRSIVTRPHQKAVVTLAFSLGEPFSVETVAGGVVSTTPPGHYARIEAGCLHSLRSNGRMAFVYVDASQSRPQLGQGEGSALAADLAGMADEGAPPVFLAVAAWRRLGLLDREQRADDGVLRALTALSANPHDFPSVRDAAALAGVSPSWFQHAMRERYGVSFRPYRLWRRMALVARGVNNGLTVTEAALEAGFSSSAHFSAAFRTMFGISFSALMKAGAIVQEVDPTAI